ncbi:MAG: aminotransferase class I/II-fold pyridoxal phosphate-dependent enzyme, partial [bacterium]
MPGYPFAELERRAAELRRQGKPLFDLSIGDPDLPPPPFLVEAVKKGFEHPQAHRYPSSRGSIEVREAIAKWYEGRFGITTDPEREVTILIGAKEGLAQLARAFIAVGDRVAFPDPGYPVYRRAGCFMLGGTPCPIPLYFENQFLPSIKDLNTCKLLYLNYPHNPTGALANRQFLQDLSAWMSRNSQTIVAYDMAYGEMTFGEPSLSLLTFNRNGVEFHS